MAISSSSRTSTKPNSTDFSPQADLFGYLPPQNKRSKSPWKDVFHGDLQKNITPTGVFELPKLEGCQVPEEIILVPFNIAQGMKNLHGCWIHFFIQDRLFERVWNNPYKYLKLFKRCDGVISPDFSMYMDMYMPQQLWNCWRNRILANWLHTKGIKVIPNVSWADEQSLSWALDGIPEKSVVALTTQGCLRSYVCKQSLLNGLHRLIREKHPTEIIIYGRFPEIWKKAFTIKIRIMKPYAENRWEVKNG